MKHLIYTIVFCLAFYSTYSGKGIFINQEFSDESEYLNDPRRPIYLVGHRCNDLSDINKALKGGCNAIECDIQCDKKGDSIYVNHNFRIRPSIDEWLYEAKSKSNTYKSSFALIIFDCKFATTNCSYVSKKVMQSLREKVRTILNEDTLNPINVIFSISKLKNQGVFTDLVFDLRKNEGIAFDEVNCTTDVQDFFKSVQVNNCWYGNGIATVLWNRKVFKSLKDASAQRDSLKIFKKTYVWTLAKKKSIEKFLLKSHVDGLLVNVPRTIDGIAPPGLAEALEVINNNNSKLRLATRLDDAFLVIKH